MKTTEIENLKNDLRFYMQSEEYKNEHTLTDVLVILSHQDINNLLHMSKGVALDISHPYAKRNLRDRDLLKLIYAVLEYKLKQAEIKETPAC